jgi:dihydrofolate reductase
MLALGGVDLISSLMNLGLIDEVHLMANPLILGGGKPLFKDVKERYASKLMYVKALKSGKVSLVCNAVLNADEWWNLFHPQSQRLKVL